jgi:hypothetical protein
MEMKRARSGPCFFCLSNIACNEGFLKAGAFAAAGKRQGTEAQKFSPKWNWNQVIGYVWFLFIVLHG